MPSWAARPLRLQPSLAAGNGRTPDISPPPLTGEPAVEWSPAAGALLGATSKSGDVDLGLNGQATADPTENGLLIAGQVWDADERPAHAVLTLTDLGGHQIARVRTDSAGGYLLQSPASGTYLLVCIPDTGAGHEPVAERITIVDGPITHNIRLES
jgi:hypothetical protein